MLWHIVAGYSTVNSADFLQCRTRSFSGADIGSDNDLVMMTFRVRLKKARKLNQPRLRFDLEKLICTFQSTICGNLYHSLD